MMGYGGYGSMGFGLGFLGPIINIVFLLVIIWVVASVFNNNKHCGSDDDPRIAKLERETEHTRDTLEKILKKLE